jgi:hypothetical protein
MIPRMPLESRRIKMTLRDAGPGKPRFHDWGIEYDPYAQEDETVDNDQMQWTTDKPTEPGFYWVFRETNEGYPFQTCARILRYATPRRIEYFVFIPGAEGGQSLDTFTQFMGPLPVPVAPGGER